VQEFNRATTTWLLKNQRYIRVNEELENFQYRISDLEQDFTQINSKKGFRLSKIIFWSGHFIYFCDL